MLITRPDVTVTEFEEGTGWELKPEGACRGKVCIPLGDAAPTTARVDIAALAERLQMPLVQHSSELSALGPAAPGGRALVTAEAPELVLPDFDGNDFRLSSLRGQKVVLVAWAPY